MDDNFLDLPGDAYRAVTLRTYNPETRQWSIWWLDGRNPGSLDKPVVGGFENGIGTFYTDDEFKGRPIRIRFRWSMPAKDSPRWEQAFSADGGANWETNWIMNFTRDADMKTKRQPSSRSCIAAVVAFCGAATAAPADDSLVGLWSYETTFGSSLHGEMTVVRRPDKWRAVVGNVETEFKPEGDRIRFAFPDDGGRFRGTLTDQGIHGFWIRPAATKDPRFPGGSSQAFATPLTLALTGQHTFIGVLRPLANPFTLYLRVFRGEDDSAHGGLPQSRTAFARSRHAVPRGAGR